MDYNLLSFVLWMDSPATVKLMNMQHQLYTSVMCFIFERLVLGMECDKIGIKCNLWNFWTNVNVYRFFINPIINN